MTLELIPNSDLIFKGPFNAVSTTALKLNNSGNERLAYKIKTTAPKRYCVKPNSGFLDPHANASIQVMLQPQPAGGQQDDRTKHKFMVQWVAVPSNYTDDVDNFWKQDGSKLKDVQDSKLKCVFADEGGAAVVPNDSFGQRDTESAAGYGDKLGNNQPQDEVSDTRMHQQKQQQQANPMGERAGGLGSGGGGSSSLDSTTNQAPNAGNLRISAGGGGISPSAQTATSSYQAHQDTGDDSSKQRLQGENQRLKDENDALKEKLKQQESTAYRRTQDTTTKNPVVAGSQQQHKEAGLALFGIPLSERIILIAFFIALLFGFTLGYFLFSCGN